MKNIYAMIGGVLFICLLGIICISIPTFALDDQNMIEVVVVENGGEKLNKNSNGYYVIDSIDVINISFKFNNYDNDSYYRYEYYWDDISKKTEYYGGSFKGSYDLANNIYDIMDINLNSDLPVTEVVINLYNVPSELASKEEGTLVYSETVKLYFNDFDTYDLSKRELYISEIKQGDKIIDPILEDGKANFNIANEDITMKLNGSNLVSDKIYEIRKYDFTTYYSNWNSFYYKNSGEVINNGVYLTVPYTIINGRDNPIVLNGISNSFIKYKVEDNSYDIVFSNCDNCNKSNDYKFDLKYKSNLDIIEPKEFNSGGVDYDYDVSPKYHDKDNSLLVDIFGSNYGDKLYDGKVTIYKNSEEVYNKEISFNGSELNNGVSVELEDFYMELPNSIEEFIYYYIYITLDNRTYISRCIYVGDYDFSTVVYYKDGKKVFNAGSGNGTYHGQIDRHYVSKNNLNNNGMYFRTVGEGFDNLEEYEYEFYYTEDWYNKNLGFDVIESGKITGLRLNTIGFIKEISNLNKYNDPSYFLVIKKDDKLVYYTGINLELTINPVIASIELYSRNKSLYFQIREGTYLASKNDSLRIKVNGEGFVDDKEYTFNVANSFELKDYTFMGKDLNESRAMIELAGMNDSSVREEGISIGSMGVHITYVDIKDLFLERTRYVVDNILDVIKDVSKSTSVSDFVDNVDIVDNGSVKVFDNLGINEVTDKVGTGMLARLVDEYDNNLIDMDIVVKGDVTGDGAISITDLVKVKKHLAKVEEIDGIYELGGDITGTGSIGITDLVKMAKDVAKIEEIK